MPAITYDENALLYRRVAKRGTGKKETGKGKGQRQQKDNMCNPEAELLRRCMLGKGRSAPKRKLTTYLRNVNRIPAPTPLTRRNPWDTRLVSVYYSAHKYFPTRHEFDSSAPSAGSRGPANRQGSFAAAH